MPRIGWIVHCYLPHYSRCYVGLVLRVQGEDRVSVRVMDHRNALWDKNLYGVEHRITHEPEDVAGWHYPWECPDGL